jgi:hypothetical protein
MTKLAILWLMNGILYLFVLGCEAQTTDTSPPLRTRYSSPDMQATFIQELEARKIPFSISSDGYVLYSRQNMKKIDAVSEIVLKKFDGPRTRYHKKELKEKFVSLLHRERINFTEESIDGEDWIGWDDHDDIRVKQLMDELEGGMTRRELELMK